MDKKAVDVVLLPERQMMEVAIEVNRRLVMQFGRKIVLDKKNCLPHISLAMGCIDEGDIGNIEKILGETAVKNPVKKLTVLGVRVGMNSVGEKVSSFEVEKTEGLQRLHEAVMDRCGRYFSYEVTKDMLYGCEEVEESTLMWVRNYREKSSFGNFWPHITVGYGTIEAKGLPLEFAVSRLALCHLGNHCTCRRILVSVKI